MNGHNGRKPVASRCLGRTGTFQRFSMTSPEHPFHYLLGCGLRLTSFLNVLPVAVIGVLIAYSI
jgi:hypothetical protein